MTVDFNEYLVRVAALEKEALAAAPQGATSDAKAFALYSQEAPPYWTNHLGAGALVSDSEALDYYTQAFQLRLIAGYITEGDTDEGELERKLIDWIPFIIEYFNQREMTQSAAYPTPIDDLRWARITDWTGVVEMASSAVNTRALGCEFTLTAEFLSPIRQVYT